jgi:hypothetical protein
MALKCHAIMKSGEMCGAMANTVVNGNPACGRTKHYFGESNFRAMTPASVHPMEYDEAVVWRDFSERVTHVHSRKRIRPLANPESRHRANRG